MANKINLRVVTPDKTTYDNLVDMLIVRTIEGDMGILYNHEPMVIPLGIGELQIKNDSKKELYAISGGFIYVTKTEATIIADSCEKPEEIDINRANEAKKRAEEKLIKKSADIDMKRAELSLKRAINRIRVADKKF